MKFFENIPFLQSKKCIGLSLSCKGGDSFEYDYIELSKIKSTINISNRRSSVANISDIIELISTSVPVIISVDGKGVLHKKCRNNDGDNDTIIFNNLFPNIDLNDFYYQTLETGDKNLHVSIIRRSIIDDIISKFEKKGLFVLDLSLGVFEIHNIIPFLEKYHEINAKNHRIIISDNRILSIEKLNGGTNVVKSNYHIDNEAIEPEFILPFSLAFTYFLNKQVSHSIDSEKLIKGKSEFVYSMFIKQAGKLVLGLLLIVLLVNFIVFTHYNNKNNSLSMQYSLEKENINTLNSLENKLRSKEKLIQDKKLFLRSRFSFFCDRIALLTPEEVQLIELDVQPLVASIEKDELIEITPAMITVKGISNSSIVVGDWITKLKQEDWTKKIIMKDYNFDNKNEKANFNIEIELKNE